MLPSSTTFVTKSEIRQQILDLNPNRSVRKRKIETEGHGVEQRPALAYAKGTMVPTIRFVVMLAQAADSIRDPGNLRNKTLSFVGDFIGAVGLKFLRPLGDFDFRLNFYTAGGSTSSTPD